MVFLNVTLTLALLQLSARVVYTYRQRVFTLRDPPCSNYYATVMYRTAVANTMDTTYRGNLLRFFSRSFQDNI